MGLLETRWESDYEGHKLVVTRNEFGRGFKIECDGTEIARRAWSLVGLGELHGSAEVGGKSLEIKVAIRWGGLKELDGTCTITVDGKEVAVRHVR